MSNDQLITFEQKNHIGYLTLNRESKLNALNSNVLEQIDSCLKALPKDCLGLIVTGAGEKAFIAGADIEAMSDMDSKQGQAFAELGQQVTLALENLNIPVIAAVNGFALGGGCEMAMACDFIYATENAWFGQPEVKLGLIPGFGGTQRLSRYIGRNRARHYIYTGENFNAQTAMDMGLVLKIFANKQSMINEAEQTLLKILQNSPLAVGISKQVMNQANDLTIEQGLAQEALYFGKIFSSFDMKEGTKAFVEKRKAKFEGR